MDKLIVNPTPTSEWCELVSEASHAGNIELNEDLESYLVFLLMRFTTAPEITKKIMALTFLESAHQHKSQQQQTLRDVGDGCLLLSGLFPGIAQRKQLRVSYYVGIGKTAYLSLSENILHNSESDLFSSLGEQFVPLMETLQVMRELDNNQLSLEPLQAEEIWNDTGSSHALKTLEKFTSSRPISPSNISPLKH